MGYRVLVPSYLKNNHTDSLRHELCEIIYNDYKGRTFTLDRMLEEKKEVLKKVYDFFKDHAEIAQYKEDSKYWYPYENVNGSKNLRIYNQFYPNTEDEITYFCKEGEDSFKNSDYLFDPVKIQFLLMCQDIRTMDCNSKTAKEIIKINNELFKVLFEKIGETINYSGKNTLESINEYIKKCVDLENEARNNTEHTQEYRDMLVRDYRRFNESAYLLEKAIIVCNADQLEKELPHANITKNTKKKI